MLLIRENNVIYKSTLLLLSGVLIFCSGIVQAQEQEQGTNPYVLLETVATKTFSRLKKESQLIDENPELLRKVIEEELLPYIHYRFAASMVLGKYYKTIPKEKLPEYFSVFRSYLITTYALALTYYDGQDVTFEPAREIPINKKKVTVKAMILEPGRDNIILAFAVRKDKKTNMWKAYDMKAQGVSVISGVQTVFHPILSKKDGIEKVIDLMKSTINRPISIVDKKEES
jgi:phospholipid transport system substrate-binding protein